MSIVYYGKENLASSNSYLHLGLSGYPLRNEPSYRIRPIRSRMCRSIKAGKPKMKVRCLVLCRHTLIPIIPPKAPPKAATANSRFSGIRLLCMRAFLLSIPISRKASRLRQQIYPVITQSSINSSGSLPRNRQHRFPQAVPTEKD
jgi:hypothetical protein